MPAGVPPGRPCMHRRRRAAAGQGRCDMPLPASSCHPGRAGLLLRLPGGRCGGLLHPSVRQLLNDVLRRCPVGGADRRRGEGQHRDGAAALRAARLPSVAGHAEARRFPPCRHHLRRVEGRDGFVTFYRCAGVTPGLTGACCRAPRGAPCTAQRLRCTPLLCRPDRAAPTAAAAGLGVGDKDAV